MKLSPRLPHADYLSDCFDIEKRERTIARLIDFIKNNNLSFDSLAVMGVSGLVIGSILSHKLGINLCVARKARQTHSVNQVESGIKRVESYLIVDDITDSGKTARSIIKKIRGADNIEGAKRCIGGIFYNWVELELKQFE